MTCSLSSLPSHPLPPLNSASSRLLISHHQGEWSRNRKHDCMWTCASWKRIANNFTLDSGGGCDPFFSSLSFHVNRENLKNISRNFISFCFLIILFVLFLFFLTGHSRCKAMLCCGRRKVIERCTNQNYYWTLCTCTIESWKIGSNFTWLFLVVLRLKIHTTNQSCVREKIWFMYALENELNNWHELDSQSTLGL